MLDEFIDDDIDIHPELTGDDYADFMMQELGLNG